MAPFYNVMAAAVVSARSILNGAAALKRSSRSRHDCLYADLPPETQLLYWLSVRVKQVSSSEGSRCKICRDSHDEAVKFEGPMMAISARLAASRLHYA